MVGKPVSRLGQVHQVHKVHKAYKVQKARACPAIARMPRNLNSTHKPASKQPVRC